MFDLEISYHLNHNNENNNDVTICNSVSIYCLYNDNSMLIRYERTINLKTIIRMPEN